MRLARQRRVRARSAFRCGGLVAIALLVSFAGACRPVGVAPVSGPRLPEPSIDRRTPADALPGAPESEVARPETATDRSILPGVEVGAGGALPIESLPRDVRALWVVRTALAHPDSARAAVRRARAAGFNTLLVQVRGRGDAFYASRREPRSDVLEGQPAGFDPLAVVLDEASRQGISVHAWVNAQLVASAQRPPRDPRHLVRARPDWLAVPRELASELFAVDPHEPRYREAIVRWTLANQATVEGLFASPVHPEAVDHLVRVVGDLVERYPLDGVHLDYLRFPSPEFDYSRASLEAFRVWVRDRMGGGASGPESRWPADPLAYVRAFPVLWSSFREAHVSDAARRLASEVRRIRPGTLITAAVFPDPDDARGARYQDWGGWVRGGIVDVVVPMAYSSDERLFGDQIRRAVELAGARRVWAGVGVYQSSFEGSLAKSRMAAGLGASGTVLFSYDWAVSEEGRRAAGGSYLDRYGASMWGSGAGIGPGR